MSERSRTAKVTPEEKASLAEFLNYVKEVKRLTDEAVRNIPSYTLAVEPRLMDTLIDVLTNPKKYV